MTPHGRFAHLPDRPRPAWAMAPAIALAMVLLLDVLPTWLLSVTAIYGQAGDTSVYAMAGFALFWFVVAGIALPTARMIGPGRAVPAFAVIAAVARLVLQTDASPTLQVYASSVLLLALLCWLVAAAAHQAKGRTVAGGIAAGFAASATLQVALGGVAPLWQRAAVGWSIGAALVVAFVPASVLAVRSPGEGRPAASSLWFALGPALVLAAVVTAAPLRATLGVTAGSRWPQLLVPLGAVVGVRLAVSRLAAVRAAALAGAALVVLIGAAMLPRATVDGVHGVLPAWAVVPQALGAAVLGLVLGRLGSRTGPSGIRRGVAAWAGLLVAFLACFLYYAAYVIDLGLDNASILLGLAVVLAVMALGADRREARVPAAPRTRTVTAGALVVVVLLGLPGVLQAGPLAPSSGHGSPIRLVSYNIHVGGVSQDGRFDPNAIAEVIRSAHPDVVWLSEVDRGWLVDGRHDALPRIAHKLGMRYLYAPAADPDWGDAVLSRYPMQVREQWRLPGAGAPTGAQAMGVVIDLGEDEHLALVGTHLQTLADNVSVPVAQARSVTALGRDLERQGYPVVITGDFNVPPDNATMAPLNAHFRDGLAPWRPVRTWPADDPVEQLDQIYVTPSIRLTDVSVPATTAADHRPVVATLRLR